MSLEGATGPPSPDSALNESDLTMFARFGIETDLLTAAGVCRVTDAEAREHYGMRFNGDLAGIVYPYFNPLNGDRWTARLRRDKPEVDSEGKPQNKYISAWGDNRHLHFPPRAGALLGDASVPVVIVEAEKSDLALTALAAQFGRSLLAIGTGGCWGWRGKTGITVGPKGEREQVRGPLPDLDGIAWTGRKAIIIFDANVVSNSDVRAARIVFADNLRARGAKVYLVNLPAEEGVNGPDDYIADRGGKAMFSLIDNAGEYERSIIVLRPGESPEALDAAEEIVLVHAERLRLFQRAGEVVRIIELDKHQRSDGLDRQPGTMMLVPVTAIALTEIMDRLIVWQRLRKGTAGLEPVRIDCPDRIAVAYLSRLGLWRLPVLAGIISAPIMRPNGTALCSAGYDPQTGLYLTEDWPEVNRDPTRHQALAALRELQEPFSEFPFVAPEDHSVLIAAVLTALQRRLLDAAPLFAFTAPAPRTGKSLLAECVAMIATGMEAPAMTVSGDREELRKAVAAVLREGHAIVNLDNIEHPLGSPDLSRAITQSVYGDRLLGTSRMLRLPTNLTWTATGNNLTFRGDLAVRALSTRLDARLERPEEREFEIAELKSHIREQRRVLVAAAMTILRAFVAAGKPDQALKPWGGFNEWSATIRAPLVWLGMADPCTSRKHVIENDPDREQAAAVLSAWHAEFGGEAVRIAEVIERAASQQDLKSALRLVAASKGDANELDARRVGWFCRDWRDRLVNGLVLAKGKDYGKVATWMVGIGQGEGGKVSGVSEVSGVKDPSIKSERERTTGSDGSDRGENNPVDPTDPQIAPDGMFADGTDGKADEGVRL